MIFFKKKDINEKNNLFYRDIILIELAAETLNTDFRSI